MNARDRLSNLRQAASQSQDWRSRYVQLALERLEIQMELVPNLAEERLNLLEELLAQRFEPAVSTSPLQALFEALERRLKSTLTVDQYEEARATLHGTLERQGTWVKLRELLAQPASKELVLLPKLPSPKASQRRRTALTIQILKRLAETERNRPARQVRADREELRNALDACKGGEAKLEQLLKRLEVLS